MEKKEIYYDIHCQIRSAYKYGGGWINTSDKEVFRNEICHAFRAKGWDIIFSTQTSQADTAKKGKSELYLHPMVLVGHIDQGLIDEVEEVLRNGESFQLNCTIMGKRLFDISDEEYRSILESKRDEIRLDILKAFQTKRSDKLISGSCDILDKIAETYRIPRLSASEGIRCSNDIERAFVHTLFDECVAVGKIKQKELRPGKMWGLTGYRTTSKSYREAVNSIAAKSNDSLGA